MLQFMDVPGVPACTPGLSINCNSCCYVLLLYFLLQSLTVSILSEDVLTRLESKKWDERLDAIKEFHELIMQHSTNISHDQRIVKVTFVFKIYKF